MIGPPSTTPRGGFAFKIPIGSNTSAEDPLAGRAKSA
jgi:hypothetical protein